ncbi:MAG: HAMP domain-containing protein [Rhodoferax sp.]|nr:HAMP domain-containing protein [Rhodoferax sp.]
MNHRLPARIWVQMLATMAAALVCVWIAVIVWQGHVSRQAALQQAEDFTQSMYDATMAGLTGMMVTGTVGQREVFLDQVKQLGSVRDVRVLRGERVSQQFGPGNGKDTGAPDAQETQVLASGRPLVLETREQGEEYLRTVRPILAQKSYLGKDCTTCHQVPEGTVLGSVSMKVSLHKVNEQLADQRLKSVLAAIFTSVPVLMLIYPFIQRVVTRPLHGAVDAARRIAAGDLAQAIPTTSANEVGELQRALQEMNDGLTRIVQQVRSGTDAIFTASREIANGNADLSQRTETQATTLEQTALAMDQLTEAVNHNAQEARRANALAVSASDIATRGGAAVGEVVQTMATIHASSQRITDIVGVIDGIAFQTSILALNAAVEAARAGEQGRGFAVVAAEVRALAGRSSEAAREIHQLIGSSAAQVEAGGAQVQQAGRTMQEIVESIRQVTAIMGEIAAASERQTQDIERVHAAVGDMNTVTQQNAALVEQAAAGAQALQDQAEQLERTVGAFKLR